MERESEKCGIEYLKQKWYIDNHYPITTKW